jgi:hypothetical protein
MDVRIKGVVASAAGGLLAVANRLGVTAQDDLPDVASAGNGGVATASANGGAVAIGDVNSGLNSGNAIAVGDTSADTAVDGGSSASATNISISANGGTAIADASGGDGNLAFVS